MNLVDEWLIESDLKSYGTEPICQNISTVPFNIFVSSGVQELVEKQTKQTAISIIEKTLPKWFPHEYSIDIITRVKTNGDILTRAFYVRKEKSCSCTD